ncbi:MAG: hypothetical protein BJ554DRAFT_6804 [Olpidium bornovanus]|uniref:RRM domain-containing protein n=1 Tax=Olpidium bornovanus TaxID=278681 RepID=A0A8H8DJY0_9FUNG|nr:MAG: hypothetical protein BJ554DRAFT_6804 [Olpidium bornovanus]
MSPRGANQSKRQQQPEPVTQRLYVGGLSTQVTAEELTARFQPFGRVDDCHLPRDVLSGACRGFGYVTLTAPEEKLKRCAFLPYVKALYESVEPFRSAKEKAYRPNGRSDKRQASRFTTARSGKGCT